MNKQAMMDEFRKGATAHATKAVKEGGLGIEDDENAERLVDMVEQEADKWAKQVALATGGEIDKEASVGVDNDALNGFILKMAEHAIEEAGGPEAVKEAGRVSDVIDLMRRAGGGVGGAARGAAEGISGAAGRAGGKADDVLRAAARKMEAPGGSPFRTPGQVSVHPRLGRMAEGAGGAARAAGEAITPGVVGAGAAGGGALVTLGALVATMGGEDPEGMSENELVAKGQEAAEQLEGMDLGTRGLGAAGAGAAGYGLAGLPGAAVGGGLGAMTPEIIDLIQGAVGGEA